MGNGLTFGFAQGICLGFSAAFCYRFGKIREQHREPQPKRDLEIETDQLTASCLCNEQRRCCYTADLHNEHDRILEYDSRVEFVNGIDDRLAKAELRRLKPALDGKRLRKGTKDLKGTTQMTRLVVLLALTTGMRASEIFGLRWPDVMYDEGLLAVRAKLKGGKMRYVPMLPEVAGELKRYPVVISDDRIFPPRKGAYGSRRRLEGSFEDLLRRAKISNFRFHDLRHTFASWYMMNGGDLYELAKILGHSNIKMTERYAKLGRKHIARTGNTAREIWKLMELESGDKANVG